MAKKNSENIDMKSIKEYERAMRSKAVQPSEEKVEFDSWWATRSPVLNQPNHLKEILKADAKARGLGKEETLDRWDWAARQFGLTL
jgi:hypothetical protein